MKFVADKIKDLVLKAVKDLGLPQVKFTVEHPAEEEHGDYATNVAMVIPKDTGKNPKEVAEQVAEKIRNSKFEIRNYIDKVDVAGPGFINFYLSEPFLLDEAGRILHEGSHYAKATRDAKRKVCVEYTDPNPFKEFHIGHLYSNAVGEALC